MITILFAIDKSNIYVASMVFLHFLFVAMVSFVSFVLIGNDNMFKKFHQTSYHGKLSHITIRTFKYRARNASESRGRTSNQASR